MRAVVVLGVFLAVAPPMFGQASAAKPAYYDNTLRREVGPDLLKNDRRADFWIMDGTNRFFAQNPKASYGEWKAQFNATIQAMNAGTAMKSDLKFGVDMMRQLLPSVPYVGPVLDKAIDLVLEDQYRTIDASTTIDFPQVNILQAADILESAERCVVQTSCRAAYDAILKERGIAAGGVKGVVAASGARKLDPKQPADQLRIVANPKSKKTPTNDERAAAVQSAQLAYLQKLASDADSLTQALRNESDAIKAERIRTERIGNLRAANYLMSTALGLLDKEAGYRFGVATDAYAQVLDVLTRKDISQLVAAASIVQGVMTFASLMNSNGSSFEAATLEGIRQIQQQIADLRREMNLNFSALNWKIDAVYRDLARTLQDVTDKQVDLATGIASLQAQVTTLSKQLEQVRADTGASFRSMDDMFLKNHGACIRGGEIASDRFIDCITLLEQFTTDTAADAKYIRKDALVTVRPETFDEPLPQTAGILARYAKEHAQIPVDANALARMPNVFVWSRGAGLYVTAIDHHAHHASKQRLLVREDLRKILESADTAATVATTMANGHATLFAKLQEDVNAAAAAFHAQVKRTYVSSVRVSSGGTVALPGAELFATRTDMGVERPPDYDLFGSADQVRANVPIDPQRIQLCPSPAGPTTNNEAIRGHSLKGIIGYPRPLHALYGGSHVLPYGSIPPAAFAVVPPAVRMYSDITGAPIGVCMSDVNWRLGKALVFQRQGVFLHMTFDWFVGSYQANNVFATVDFDVSNANDPLYGFPSGDVGGGHGDHIVHKMMNFLRHEGGHSLDWNGIVGRLINPQNALSVNQTVVQRLTGEVEVELARRREILATALARLLRLGRQDESFVFEGTTAGSLVERFDSFRTAYLLFDRMAALLLSESYVRDSDGIASKIGIVDPQGYVTMLDLITKAHSCAATVVPPTAVSFAKSTIQFDLGPIIGKMSAEVSRATLKAGVQLTGCSVAAHDGKDPLKMNFLSPLALKRVEFTKASSGVDRYVFSVEPLGDAVAAAVAATDARFAFRQQNKLPLWESIPMFDLVRKTAARRYTEH